jgi:hypothetical protein
VALSTHLHTNAQHFPQITAGCAKFVRRVVRLQKSSKCCDCENLLAIGGAISYQNEDT